MSLLHIANYFEAPRLTVNAAVDLDLGEVIKVVTGAVTGARYAQRVTAAADVQKAGQWGVAMKISADPFQVSSSTVSSALGDRIVTIASGDAIVQVGAGAIIEFHRSLFHDSLDPDRSGVLPVVGDSLGVATSSSKARFSSAASSSLTNVGTTIHVARVFRTFGTKVLVQLFEA